MKLFETIYWRSGKDSDSSKSAVDSNRKSNTTTGQAGSGAKLSTEQRSKITTVLRKEKVQPVTNVNFSMAVGTRVPRTVNFYPLPTAIVEIYPAWSGYQFFLVGDEIYCRGPAHPGDRSGSGRLIEVLGRRGPSPSGASLPKGRD